MRKISKLLFMLSFLLGIVFKNFGQSTNNDIYSPIAKTPEVSSVNKFIETPVNTGTGIPEINIPIYTLSQGEYSLPISVSYHAGGIRVDEMASSVGLGWALNAGGVVSRTVRKEPDEYGYYHQGWSNRRPIGCYMPPGFCTTVPCLVTWEPNLTSADDTEPDIFSFSFSGHSGKVLFDKDGIARIIPEQDLKIEWYPISGFIFTTSDGTKFIFNPIASDKTTTYGIQVTQNELISAWHLTKIITPTLKEINFEYQNYGYQTQELEPESFNAHTCSDIYPYIRLMTHTLNGSIIKRIYSDICEINFNYKNTAREDAKQPAASFALDNIKVFNKLENTIIKNFNFSTSYFICNGIGGSVNYHQSIQTYLSKRLRLDAITECDANGNCLPPYTFSYNKYNSVVNLPNKVSTGQDHWGFYNGKNENQTLIANPTTNPLTVLNSCVGLANRDVDPSFQKAFILDEVVFPTGGKTKYLYENIYFPQYNSYMGGLRVKSITNISGSSQSPLEKTFQYGTPYLAGGPPVYVQQIFPDLGGSGFLCQGNYSPANPNPCLIGPNHFMAMSNPVGSTSEISSNYVIYDHVYEKQAGNGWTENYYDVSSLDDEIDLADIITYPYIPKNPILLSGKLISQKVKDESGNILKESNFTYNSYRRYAIKNADALRVSNANCLETLIPYFLLTGAAYLTQRDETIRGITKTINYYYDGIPSNVDLSYSGNISFFISKTIETTSKGENISNNFKYPFDFATTSPYNEMITRNILSPVIENTLTNTTLNKELNKSRVNFGFWQGNTIILPTTVQKSLLGNPLQTEVTVNGYDDKGNILQTTTKSGLITSYFWGYMNQYLVAKIIGKSYADALSQSNINLSILNSPANDNTLKTETNKLRSLSNSVVTTYTYKPLLGINAETDPNGHTKYYEYDNFNRLSIIRDQENNILKKVCYNYAGQVEDCPLTNNTVAQWRATGNSRCQPCASNIVYNSGIKEKEEKDINPNSPTYNDPPRWVVDQSGSCPSAPPIYAPRNDLAYCENINGVNTGNLITPTYDSNPCSPTYFTFGPNTITPNHPPCLPCVPACISHDYKCINGVCTLGVLKVVRVRRLTKYTWECTKALCFPDGTFDANNLQTFTSSIPCDIECF